MFDHLVMSVSCPYSIYIPQKCKSSIGIEEKTFVFAGQTVNKSFEYQLTNEVKIREPR
jgi:hypothetical protein